MKENKKMVRKAVMLGVAMLTIGNNVYTLQASTINVFTRTVIERNFPQNTFVEKSKKEVEFTDVTGEPKTFDGRTYVPLKVICDELGIKAGYNQETRATEITMNEKKIELFNNNYMAKINGEWKPLDTRDGKIITETTCRIINGKTYVPVRFVSEELGLKVVSQGNEIYIDKVEKLTKIKDMEPGKKYSIGSILYQPLQEYQPGWNDLFLNVFDQESGNFDFENNTMTRYTDEQVKEGIFISPDVKLYGAMLDGDTVKVEISKPVYPRVIFFESSPELKSDEIRGYERNPSLKIEKLSNGNYLVEAAKFDPRYKNIKHLGIRIINRGNEAIPSDNNTVVIDVDM